MQNGAEVKESIWMEREETESAIRSECMYIRGYARLASSLMNISAVTKRSECGKQSRKFSYSNK